MYGSTEQRSPGLTFVTPGADGEHFDAEFVAGDARIAEERHLAEVAADVGAADADAMDAHQGIRAGTGLLAGDVERFQCLGASSWSAFMREFFLQGAARWEGGPVFAVPDSACRGRASVPLHSLSGGPRRGNLSECCACPGRRCRGTRRGRSTAGRTRSRHAGHALRQRVRRSAMGLFVPSPAS